MKTSPWPLILLAVPVFPIAADQGQALYLWQVPIAALCFLVSLAALAGQGMIRAREWRIPVQLIGVAAGYALPLLLLGQGYQLSSAAGLWLHVAAATLLLWVALGLVAELPRPQNMLGPALFGLALLMLWEVLTRGFEVPRVLLPPPSGILGAFFSHGAELWYDFHQTVVRSVLRGYVIGCAAGFAVAILADRIPFLARGLLPLGNLASAVPVIGIAPIMVMWFGFDWQSKAAVIVVMTFFPMMINTLAGLKSAEKMQLDLMRSYAAGYWRTLFLLRLPTALPFLFNGLKINSTLALIGAIVAEFFGTPVVGMGFRISTEVARMNLDVVWATIAVAAVTGSAFYGLIALAERHATAWHPSFRKR
ncbi:ABC transporter permease [Telmatospirillum sp. J64-1]|uniref:ABC transporter permease n=1 Tax=Telmatospirillum sp. J64-1 TaxID=2502183 RepID=UPI00115F48A1|nr:ABC transporter permease [Telmatospirillum sp. J64-1]